MKLSTRFISLSFMDCFVTFVTYFVTRYCLCRPESLTLQW